MDKRDLLTTSEAARHLGVHRRTLARYAELEQLAPALVLPSGHLRWRLLDLERQLEELRRRRAEINGTETPPEGS